jgi:hypothetical protein
MKPKIKYWQTLKQLEKGWVIPALDSKSCPHQYYEKEAEFDELHRDTLLQELIQNKYIICGDTHQYQAIPIFNDGYLLLSMRVWNELMQEAYDIMSDDIYTHDFYMACLCQVEEKLPPTAEIHTWKIQ